MEKVYPIVEIKYHWINFDYKQNLENERRYGYTDGGHFMGPDSKTPEHFYNKITSRSLASKAWQYTKAEAIEKNNDNTSNAFENANLGKDITAGIVAGVVSGGTCAGLYASSAASASAGLISAKLLKIEPIEVKLDPGGFIIQATEVEVIRSYNEKYENSNGIRTTTTLNVWNNGNSTQIMKFENFIPLKPITNSAHNKLMMSYEAQNGQKSHSLIKNDIPFNFIFR